jgi:hypothetical protein
MPIPDERLIDSKLCVTEANMLVVLIQLPVQRLSFNFLNMRLVASQIKMCCFGFSEYPSFQID